MTDNTTEINDSKIKKKEVNVLKKYIVNDQHNSTSGTILELVKFGSDLFPKISVCRFFESRLNKGTRKYTDRMYFPINVADQLGNIFISMVEKTNENEEGEVDE